MDGEKTAEEIGRYLVAKIVRSYLTHNRVAANDLSSVIASVHQAVSGLGKAASPAEPLTPAVPVRQSVRPDYVVCLECGFRSRTLRRHLRVSHGLERAAYYARWRLPPDHPITAPGYSARRSALAKALGLGRRRQMAKTAPEPKSAPAAKQRRRRRVVAAEAAPTR
jgi:predicted transcriptional regulator